MIHRRAAIVFILSNAALAGCANHPQPPREQPMFMQQDQAQAPAESEPVASESEQPVPPAEQPASDGAANTWAPVESSAIDALADQSSQNLALAMSSTDANTRIEYLDAAASLGNGQAHYELAKVYTEGVDRPRDLKLAQEHLVAAASANDPEATRVIGWQMIKGQGGHEQNINGGVAVMEMAVTKSVRTQRELGSLYGNLYADFKLNDPVKGEAYLKEAYSSGDVPAAVALGKLYIQQGRQAEAVAPLAFATDKNDPAAAKLLASIGGASAGVDAPAQHGNPDGSNSETYYQQASAIMMRTHSVDDEAKAYALFSLAADKGHNLARAELGAISGVKILMDKQLGAGWLEAEKQRLQYGAQQ
jgi:TPR repeat protein